MSKYTVPHQVDNLGKTFEAFLVFTFEKLRIDEATDDKLGQVRREQTDSEGKSLWGIVCWALLCLIKRPFASLAL